MSSAAARPEKMSDANLVREIMTAMSLADMEDKMDVPKLVACGDQSAGKSSVLEVQAMLEFPKAEGTCTTWATVVVMRPPFVPSTSGGADLSAKLGRHGTGLHATIIPSSTRSQAERATLKAWSMTCADKKCFKDIMTEANKELKGEHGSLICKDRLLVTIYTKTPGVFGFVDLPGLVRDAVPPMTMADKKQIEELVVEYMKNPRTLILAVIQAGDLSLSEVSRMAKEADPKGERTIGVLTKPDVIDRSPLLQQKTFELLLQPIDNKQRSLPLGWFVTKNRDPLEQDMTETQRAAAEKAWFQSKSWADIPEHLKGAVALGDGITKAVLKILRSMLHELIPDVRATIAKMEFELTEAKKDVVQIESVRQYCAERFGAAAQKVAEMLKQQKKDIRAPVEAAIEDATVLLDSQAQAFDFDRSILLSAHETRTQQEYTGLVPLLDQRRSLADLLKLTETYLPERCVGLPDESIADQHIEKLFYQLSSRWHYVIDHLAARIADVLLDALEQSLKSTLPAQHVTAVMHLARAPTKHDFVQALKDTLPKNVEAKKGAVDDQDDAMLLAAREHFFDNAAELSRHASLKHTNSFPEHKKLVARQLIASAQVMYFASVKRYMRDVSADDLCSSMIGMVQTFPKVLSDQVSEEALAQALGLSEQAKDEIIRREDRLEHARCALHALIELQKRNPSPASV